MSALIIAQIHSYVKYIWLIFVINRVSGQVQAVFKWLICLYAFTLYLPLPSPALRCCGKLDTCAPGQQ
jgi:hypothetical protein